MAPHITDATTDQAFLYVSRRFHEEKSESRQDMTKIFLLDH